MIVACMCYKCRFRRVIEDENGKLFSICANRKSYSFLNELEIAFDYCEFGEIEDEDD